MVSYCIFHPADSFANFARCLQVHLWWHHGSVPLFCHSRVCYWMCVCVCVCVCGQWLTRIRLFVTSQTVAPGCSVHGISQARILEWVAISSSRRSSQPRDQIYISSISCTGRRILYHSTTWEGHAIECISPNFVIRSTVDEFLCYFRVLAAT